MPMRKYDVLTDVEVFLVSTQASERALTRKSMRFENKNSYFRASFAEATASQDESSTKWDACAMLYRETMETGTTHD